MSRSFPVLIAFSVEGYDPGCSSCCRFPLMPRIARAYVAAYNGQRNFSMLNAAVVTAGLQASMVLHPLWE